MTNKEIFSKIKTEINNIGITKFPLVFLEFLIELEKEVLSKQSSKIIDGKCMMCDDVADTEKGWMCEDFKKF